MNRTPGIGLAIAGWLLSLPAGSTGASDLGACRKVPDDAARLACYDALGGGSGPAVPALAADAPSAPPATPPAVNPAFPAAGAVGAAAPALSATPSPEELFGRDAVASEAIVRQAAGIGQLEEMRVRIAHVQTDPYGKLILTLANGQVWSQLDSPAPKIRTGEEALIRRAAIGSYLLIRDAGGRGIRVRRSR